MKLIMKVVLASFILTSWPCFADPTTNLFKAIYYGDKQAVSQNIEAGANLNQFFEGSTPLMAAVKAFIESQSKSSSEIVDIIIQSGADLEARHKPDNQTPLLYAAKKHSFEMVKILLDRGADAHVIDDHGMTALMYASNYPYPVKSKAEVGDFIVKPWEGSSYYSQPNSPGYGNDVKPSIQIVKLLLQVPGIQLDIQNKVEGQTALMFAVQYNTEITKLLIAKGADVNLQNVYGHTALMIVSAVNTSKFFSSQDILNALLQAPGIDLNLQDKRDRTALMIALTKLGTMNQIEALVRAGADKEINDNTGERPLMRAVVQNNYYAVEYLLKNGANVHAKMPFQLGFLGIRKRSDKTALDIARDTYANGSGIEKLLKLYGATTKRYESDANNTIDGA